MSFSEIHAKGGIAWSRAPLGGRIPDRMIPDRIARIGPVQRRGQREGRRGLTAPMARRAGLRENRAAGLHGRIGEPFGRVDALPLLREGERGFCRRRRPVRKRENVGRESVEVLVGLIAEEIDDGSHRAGGDAVILAPALDEIVEERILGPRNGCGRLRIQRRTVPALDVAAAEFPVRQQAAEGVSGRVAGSAVAKTFRQIGTPVPGRVARRILLQGTRSEEQEFPAGEQRPEIERESKRVLRRRAGS